MAASIALCLALLALHVASAEKLQFDIIVPEFKVARNDGYVCTTIALPKRPFKLTGVEPLAEESVVHHILLFGERSFAGWAEGCMERCHLIDASALGASGGGTGGHSSKMCAHAMRPHAVRPRRLQHPARGAQGRATGGLGLHRSSHMWWFRPGLRPVSAAAAAASSVHLPACVAAGARPRQVGRRSGLRAPTPLRSSTRACHACLQLRLGSERGQAGAARGRGLLSGRVHGHQVDRGTGGRGEGGGGVQSAARVPASAPHPRRQSAPPTLAASGSGGSASPPPCCGGLPAADGG